MLGSASGSLPNYPGHPPAAPGGLGSLVPDLVLGPRKALDISELQQPGRRDTTRFFGTGSRVPMDWAASAIKPGRQSLNRTSMDRRRRRKGSVAGRPRNFTPCVISAETDLFPEGACWRHDWPLGRKHDATSPDDCSFVTALDGLLRS